MARASHGKNATLSASKASNSAAGVAAVIGGHDASAAEGCSESTPTLVVVVVHGGRSTGAVGGCSESIPTLGVAVAVVATTGPFRFFWSKCDSEGRFWDPLRIRNATKIVFFL